MATHELPKTYDFRATEQRIYTWWEQSGYFRPVNDPGKPGFDPSSKTICHLNSTTECYRGAACRACHVRLGRGFDDPVSPDEGNPDLVGTGL